MHVPANRLTDPEAMANFEKFGDTDSRGGASLERDTGNTDNGG